MTVIRIRERGTNETGENAEGMRAVVEFDHGLEYEVVVRDPFGEEPQKEEDLAWYFEEYLTFPFTQKPRMEHAAESIQAYGESLFGQIFGDGGALEEYRRARDEEGVSGLRVEIAGSAGFQRLHWEALYDSELGGCTWR